MNETDGDDSPTLATNRSLDILVALILIAIALIVVYDSVRIGFGWIEGQGPAPGYFPFWVAVILGGSSLVNLVRAIRGREPGGGATFVTKLAFRRVLTVVIPVAVYIALIAGLGPVPGLGIYVASGLFISLFMIMVGREAAWKSLLAGVAVPLFLFLMFERWFLVPLPKGPIEAALGLG
jgi:hypothetical protein